MTRPRDLQLLLEREWVHYQLGPAGANDLLEAGLRLLMAGPVDADLATLAALPASGTAGVAHEAFDRFGRAHDLPFLIDPDQRLALAEMSARAIDDGRIDLEEGARIVRRLLEYQDDTPLCQP